jgi:hypothetical protein
MSDQNRPQQPDPGTPGWSNTGAPTPNQGEQQFPRDWPENSSRRKFLKTLLVGSAAAAAGGAATYVAIERVGSAPLSNYKFIGATNSSGASGASACTTGTDPKDYKPQTEYKNSESIFLWGLFTNLPAGSYTMSIDPTIEAKSGAICTTNPFEYNDKSSSKENAQLYDLEPSAVSWTCSPPKQASLPTRTRGGGSLEDVFSTPITVAAGDDLQIQIHMKNGCDAGGTYQVTISLFQEPDETTPFLQAKTSIIIDPAK